MWEQAEVVALLDAQARVTVVSRNETEAPVASVAGRSLVEMLAPESVTEFEHAFHRVLNGAESIALLAGMADAGYVFWARVRLLPSPEPASQVLFHMRRLPTSWGKLSGREREVIDALNAAGTNAKGAAKQLGISLNTLNSHRRSICQKCELQGVGDFWIFVHQCR